MWDGLLHYVILHLHLFDLFVEAFFGFMHKNHGFPMLIILWTTCSAHHLQNVGDGKINITLCFTIKILCSLHARNTSPISITNKINKSEICLFSLILHRYMLSVILHPLKVNDAEMTLILNSSNR